jgi:hypothetical protein
MVECYDGTSFLDGTRCVSQSRNDQATSPGRHAADGG